MSTTQKTVKERLQEALVQHRLQDALIAMTTEQMERFEEKDKKGLQDWERMHIAEAIVGPIREADQSRGAAKGRSVLDIELSNRANNTKTEGTVESYKERQYNAYRKGGMSESDAATMAGFEPKTTSADSLKERQYNAYRASGMSESEASATSGFTPKKAA